MDRITLTVTMADGTVHDKLAINNHALVSYDFTANKNRWPSAQDAPFLWFTFLAWQQLVDDGHYPATDEKNRTTFTAFQTTDCIDVDRLDQERVDPTLAAGSARASASQQQQESTQDGYTDAMTVS